MYQSVVAIKIVACGRHKLDQAARYHILKHCGSGHANGNGCAIGPGSTGCGISKIASGFIGHCGTLIPSVSTQPSYICGSGSGSNSWKVFVVKLFDCGTNQGWLNLIDNDVSNVIAVRPRKQYGRQNILTPYPAITAECVGA